MVVNITNSLNVNRPGATVSFRSPIFMQNAAFNSLISINMGLCSSNGMTASRAAVYFIPADRGFAQDPTCNYIFAGNSDAVFNFADPYNEMINNAIATIQLSPGSIFDGRGGKTILNSATPSNVTVSLTLPPKSGTIALTSDIQNKKLYQHNLMIAFTDSSSTYSYGTDGYCLSCEIINTTSTEYTDINQACKAIVEITGNKDRIERTIRASGIGGRNVNGSWTSFKHILSVGAWYSESSITGNRYYLGYMFVCFVAETASANKNGWIEGAGYNFYDSDGDYISDTDLSHYYVKDCVIAIN